MPRKPGKKKLKEWGRKGGQTTLQKHGSSHFAKLAEKMWEKKRQKESDK